MEMKLNKMYAKPQTISKLKENTQLLLPRDCVTHLIKDLWDKKSLI